MPPSSNQGDEGQKEQTPPDIHIVSPTAGLTTTNPTVAVSGTAQGNVVVVRWSTDRGDSGVAQGTTKWSVPAVPLKPGTTTVTVMATTVSGDVASDVLTVSRPEELPKLKVTSPTDDSQWTSVAGTVALRGTATDNVTRVTWRTDSGASGTASGTANWSIAALVLQEGVNTITLMAQDASGRTDRHVLTITYRPRAGFTAGAGKPTSRSRAGLE